MNDFGEWIAGDEREAWLRSGIAIIRCPQGRVAIESRPGGGERVPWTAPGFAAFVAVLGVGVILEGMTAAGLVLLVFSLPVAWWYCHLRRLRWRIETGPDGWRVESRGAGWRRTREFPNEGTIETVRWLRSNARTWHALHWRRRPGDKPVLVLAGLPDAGAADVVGRLLQRLIRPQP